MVARRGGLSQAADALDMAPSTVALHLAELERDLGVKLIERAGRGVRLTGAGRELSPHAESVLSAVQRMRSAAGDLRDGRGGRIGVGAVEPAASHRLPAVLAAFCERLPAVLVAVTVGGTGVLCRAVERGHLDVALCSAPPPGSTLRFEPVFVESLCLLVPHGHPLAAAGTVAAGDLAAEHLLVTEEGCAYRQATVQALASRGVSLGPVMEIGSIGALAGAVAAGLGIALVPAVGLRVPDGAVRKELADLPVGLAIGLVLPADELRCGSRPVREMAALIRAMR